MSNFGNNLINKKNPNKETKRQIRKIAYKKMGGNTAGQRFKNYFTNQNGYYAWKEMLVNYLLIIFIALTLAAGIVCLCRINKMSVASLFTDTGFICLSVGCGFIIGCLIAKFKFRKQRFKCFANNGISNNYVFWKDDKTNPKNKTTHRSFE